jgi:predicted MFS family arabinose efflux permease
MPKLAQSIAPLRLVALVCTAQVLVQIGAFTWPALLPGFIERWSLSNSEAGWITGIFYASYTLSVPILVTLTDRLDPRTVYLSGVALTVLSHLGFATVADGFWGAAAARVVGGIGWAGTYMTGLKLLADRVDLRLMSRAVAGHAASLGVSGALSFVVAGTIASWLGWRAAFAGAAVCAVCAWSIVFLVGPSPARNPQATAGADRLFDFRPVLRNRSAMAYAIAYCAHTWELNALRGWAVAFLAYVAAYAQESQPWIAPTAIATAIGLVGTWASVTGNELSIRVGRQRLVRLSMAGSICCAAVIGFFAAAGYTLACGLVLLYGFFVWLDSSSLTAGAASAAAAQRRGATLALHSMLGYAGGFLGPLAIGWTLDLAGGMSPFGWGLAFLQIAIVMLIGRLCFNWLRPDDLVGDRNSARR